MPRADPLPSVLEREGRAGRGAGGLVQPGLGSKTYICSGPRPSPLPCPSTQPTPGFHRYRLAFCVRVKWEVLTSSLPGKALSFWR